MTNSTHDQDAEFQYVSGQVRSTFLALLAGFAADSASVMAESACALDLAYGPAPRQTFYFFAARGPCRATLLYFHAGYWQSRDKADFRFITPAFTDCGVNVALINYPLCPEVSLAQLVQACHMAPPAVAAHVVTVCGQPTPLIVAGHSAGAHIAIELALQIRAGATVADQAPRLAGVVALSGIYDLLPLVETSLNRKLHIDLQSAAMLSPLRRVVAGLPPALFAVGAAETPAFIEQSRQMHQAWRAAGNVSQLQVVEAADHFSLLQQFTHADSALHTATLAIALQSP